MNAGKPKDQSIAIAYSVKRKNAKKKMAKGGMVNETVPSEMRPMPSEKDKDAAMISRNSSTKAPHMDSATDQPERMQTAKGRTIPLSRPKIMGSDAFSVRTRDEIEQDLRRMDSMPPESDEAQPSSKYDEEMPNRQGPNVPSLRMKRMAKGGMINDAISMDSAEEDEVEHPMGLESDNDEMAPAVDEYMAGHMARGGMVDPDDEMMMDDDASIAATIMAKRRKMAAGGMVDIDSNNEEQPNGYYARNEDAVLRENYDSDMDDVTDSMDSNEHSPKHDEEDINDADIVSAIRRKMKSRSPIAR